MLTLLLLTNHFDYSNNCATSKLLFTVFYNNNTNLCSCRNSRRPKTMWWVNSNPCAAPAGSEWKTPSGKKSWPPSRQRKPPPFPQQRRMAYRRCRQRKWLLQQRRRSKPQQPRGWRQSSWRERTLHGPRSSKPQTQVDSVCISVWCIASSKSGVVVVVARRC